ncbi:MAG: TonB-dependent receptor [Prevotella sp.]|nr:TonB-dependent receptor [Prevotella sp.]MBR3078423.1 TonB-dependent receptor [Prevotella sp.]
MRKSSFKQFMLIVLMFTMQAVFGTLSAKSISGKVTSSTDGEPLIGATVQVQGDKNGVVTDFDGNYVIQAEKGQTLVFSYVGYLTKTVKIGDANTIDVVLDEDRQSLDEVVVVGYGVQKKKLVTGATVQVKGENVAKLNTTNPLQALQGQTPGMTIVSESGQPGEGLKVNIRGLGTTGSSGPLYIIDGVRGDISTLNPSDIESIDVLKDAASAAIYGSQSANGVVLVTTKSGKEGRAVVSFDGYFGWQWAPRKTKMLNAKQYMTIMDEQNINSGGAPYDWYGLKEDGTPKYASIFDANGNVYDTDWVDQMFKDGAQTYSANLGITGGNQKGNFNLTMSYLNQEGIVGGKDVSGYSRYNFRINSEYQVIDNFLKVGEQVSFIYYKKNGIGVGNAYNNTLRAAFGTSPITPVYSDNGKYGSPYNDTTDSDWYNADGNPYGVMMTTNNNKSQNLTATANVYAEMEFIKNLKFRTVLGVKYDSNNYRSFSPLYHFSIYSYQDTRTGVSQSASDGLGITWTNTLSYNFKLKEHNIDAMIGYEVYRTEGQSIYGSNGSLRDGFDTWEYAYLSNGTATNQEGGLSVSGSPWDEERMVSYFGRVSWNWKERYMATATLRCDGSSRFAKGHRFGWFPSISAGWVVTNEKFMEPVLNVMDYFKIRASWGQVGNQNIGNYMYLAPMAFNNYYYNFGTTLGSDADQWGAVPTRIGNEEITWETSEQFDVGFDARFLNQRLNVNFDFYIKTTKDWLVQPPVLGTVGTGAPYINGGDVKNTGVELGLAWNDRIGKNFNYYVNVNGAYNKNKVGNIPNEDGIIHGESGSVLYDNSGEFYRASNGEPIGYFWGYKTAGIFQNQQDINDWIAAGNGVLQADVKPGDVKYYDINHDGLINDNDKVNLGNGMPDFTYGFSFGFEWKNFDFSVQAYGQSGNKIVQSLRNVGTTTANYTTQILDRWTGEGTSNKIPRVTNTNINYQFSDLFIQDGDFLRISSIKLGYDFAKLLRCKYISQCHLYAQVQNAFTFTKYDGMDPEIGYGNAGWVSGIDYGYYPRPRTFLMGVNLKF